MSLDNYGVLKGKPKDCKHGKGRYAHFQILVHDGINEHRIAVNVSSKIPPSDLLYFVDDNFIHPITGSLENLRAGFKKLDKNTKDLCLDYLRGGLFDTAGMVPLECDIPGPSNDLNDLIQEYVKKAISMEESAIYAFGERWGPESFLPDSFFGFRPGSGIHDVHMNQGNSVKWQSDNALCQDGGIIIHLPEENRWVAIFLAFQSQCFHTDDFTGNCLPDAPRIVSDSCELDVNAGNAVTAGSVKIIGALVDPQGDDSGKEAVSLFNASPDEINVDGWFIQDDSGRKSILKGKIAAGSGKRILLSGRGVILSNKGGVIELYDNHANLMDEVKYSSREVMPGWTVVF